MAYIGKTPSQAVRSRYFYTATGGETSLSGADDNGDTLIFADGNYVDVYLNGVLLVASSDYNVNTVNTIAGLTALTASDIVEIVVYDTFSVFGGVFQGDLSANTITGDMFGSHQFEAKNIEGSTIPKGTPVYIAGHSGNDPEIAIADADDPAKMPAFGITTAAIANNNKGNVIVFGNYIGLDTSGFSVGDELYVSNTGTLVNTRPSASADKVQKIAKVIRSQSQNGQIFVMGAGRSNDVPNAITTNSINLSSTTTVDSVLDEDTMTSDSATALATQQSIKAYVDSQIGSNNELSEILTNGNTTGGNDISFADNDKAIFGAGSDLQIYHDGVSASYITDQGTGNLVLGGDSAIILQNSAHNANMLDAYNGGRVGLYHANSLKLATTATGVDISGSSGATLTLTSTDTSGANTELLGQIDFVSSDISGGSAGTQARIKGVYEDNGDSSGIAFLTGASTGSGSPTINEVMRIRHEGRVGIGTSTPNAGSKLHVSGGRSYFASNSNAFATYLLYNDSTAGVFVGSPAANEFQVSASSGSNLLKINSSGNVGIGTSLPTHNLTVGSTAASDFVVALRGGVGGFFGWDDSANTTVLQAPNTRSLSFQVNSDTFSSGTEAIRIDSSGNVGIGTSSPATTLESKIGTSGLPATSGTTPANVALRLSSTATTGIIDMGLNGPNPWIQVTDRTNLGVPYNLLLNPNGGNVGIGGTTASPAGFVKSLNLEGSDVALQLRETTTNSSWEIGNDNTGLFRILNDGTERLRITSTGKVETKGRDYGFINHGTPVTIADDSTIVLNANEIGAGILTVYHRPSGQWCNFGVGYNGATIMSALNSSNFDVIDTDGRFCVIAVNHTITLKNRFGSSAGFYINFVMAGNDFAG